MKATKVLLSSFVLAGLVSACTNEEILNVTPGNDVLASRPQVNLTLSAAPTTRMGIDNDGLPVFTPNDMLGAVLVDKGYTDQANSGTFFNNVDWQVVDGHVGNNKWAYNATSSKFETEGTTAVGMWLFYTKYNEKMTTTRNGVEFDFPQIQEGAANLSYAENNNINFKITPILAINGYEGEKLDLVLQYSSVFNYLNLKLDFDSKLGVTKVQKIIVKATDAAGNDVKFPTASKVINTALPIAKLSLQTGAPTEIATPECAAPNNIIDLADQNQEILNAYNKIRVHDVSAGWDAAVSAYKSIVASANNAQDVDFLVVDCNSNHEDTSTDGSMAVTGGQFSAYMLMPSGVYNSITLDIYTDKGVYTETVKGRDAYVANKTTAGTPTTAGGILLRPGKSTVLADIEGKTNKQGDADYGVSDYLKVTGTTATTNYITKTADLINYIKAITLGSLTPTVNVIAQDQIGSENNPVDDTPITAHKVVVNKEVMEAIEAKEKELNKDIQLTFKGAKITIVGNESANSRLDIHDLTFNDGCEVFSGYVKTSEEIGVPTSDGTLPTKGIMTVKENADVEFTDNSLVINKVSVEKGAKISAAANQTVNINEIENKGTVAVAGTLQVTTLTNYATIDNNQSIKVTKGNNYGTINNNKVDDNNRGQITVKGQFNNNTTIVNLVPYNGVINNYGLLLVNGETNPEFSNKPGATINNSGDMYCYNGDNKIYNTGTINATGTASTTYITTNSEVSENTTATNAASGQTMGKLIIENRNQDVSVTTADQKGYIQYTVKDADLANGSFGWENNDKYNLLVLNSSTVILDANLNGKLRYVINKGTANLTMKQGLKLQELTFNTNSTLYTTDSDVAKLTVDAGKTVKIPTENALYVYDVTTATNASKTTAEFINNGTILVGGNLYTSIADAATANGNGARQGIFASGDGESTAFHWNETRP